jgi:hypothetical protein
MEEDNKPVTQEQFHALEKRLVNIQSKLDKIKSECGVGCFLTTFLAPPRPFCLTPCPDTHLPLKTPCGASQGHC